ncbi:MAG: amino acid adenylation domain-containing protein, partial [Rhodanobacter sp.]
MSIGTPARDAALAVDYDPFADGTLSRVVPSTEPQREIWLADQLGAEASLAYNESVSLHLRGVLDAAALHAALQSLLDRHDALRASFGPDGEALCIREQVSFELPLLDLSAADPARREQAVAERRAAVVETPFALGRDHLLRGELLRLAHDEHVLILTAHHIVCDGWSWWVLVRELGTLYAQRLGHAVEALPPAEAFADYALAQACQPDAAYAQDEQYWLARFAGEIPVLDLPTDRPRPARRSFGSAREDWTLDAELVAAIRRLGARQGASLFATLLGSFAALLIRLAHQSRVVIGIPTAGQAIDGHDALVGHCVNTLPLLFEPDLDRPAALAIEQAQTTLLDALEHQRLTFGSLLRKLRIGRDPSRLPLVSVMFNIDQALDHEDSAFPGLQLEFASNPRRYENFELAINAVQSHGELRLECQYNRELFDGATIRQWLGHYQTLLKAMAADDDTAFGRLPLLADIEQRKVLEKFNATHVDYPAGQCIHELIEAQVARTPQAIAVSHEGATLSYAGLNERANRLAHHLRASGVRPDQRVAICAERSLELVVGLLAILKAGAAYVPLDPEYPPERLAWMLQDCAPAMLLTQQALVSRLAPLAPAVPPLALDQAAPAWAECEASNPLAAANGLHDRHLAYVIYTSGSTGLPKGAMNEHRGVVNRLRWMQEMFAVDARDVVLQKTPCSFDVSVWEFFLPLMSGARLVMARPGGHRDPAYLADTIRREQVSTIHFVPSMLHAFLDHGDTAACAGLKQVICSGEALPATLAAAFFRQLPDVGLHNLYGPTEAAVDVTAWACVAGDDASSIPIGRPVANTRIYILDGYGQPVPVGVAGEIFIGGVQVGRGYLNRETLTAERFVPDPFAHDADARMYKTGDLGRWRADGNIEYLGRNDFQVKLRGFRIELGEIEHRLATHPAVAQAVVLAREDRPGDMRLVAYIAGAAGASADPAALSAHLRASLPEYMVPAHYVMLAAIPLSPNGKVDRTRLPAPDTAAGSGAREQQAPRDELEQRVAAAMAATLGVDAPGVDDNFFDLGGHSLLASRWIARLNRELGLTLSLRAAFDAPSVAAMAAAIRALGADPAQA